MQPVVRWAKAHTTLAGVVLIITSVVFACTLAEAITRRVITVRGHSPQQDPILHQSLKLHATMQQVQRECQVVYRINSQGLLEAEIHLPGSGSIALITGTLLCSSQWMHEVHQLN